jgi:AcrR family transcriptional regulator
MSPRLTATERRTRVIASAIVEFAARGLHGASTERIAEAAGISHAYVFRLFGTKKALFIACAEWSSGQIAASFEEAADAYARGEVEAPSTLAAMGMAYMRMLSERRDHLLLQLHSFAASDDDEIRESAQRSYGRVWRLVAGLSGCDAAQAQTFFSHGMRLSVAAAMKLEDLAGPDASWASALRGAPLTPL